VTSLCQALSGHFIPYISFFSYCSSPVSWISTEMSHSVINDSDWVAFKSKVASPYGLPSVPIAVEHLLVLVHALRRQHRARPWRTFHSIFRGRRVSQVPRMVCVQLFVHVHVWACVHVPQTSLYYGSFCYNAMDYIICHTGQAAIRFVCFLIKHWLIWLFRLLSQLLKG
jgi:hypothetical protein